MKQEFVLLCTVALMALPGWGQLQIPAFESLAAKAVEVNEINLDPAMLQLAGGFFRSAKEGDALKALSGLKSLVVRNLRFAGAGEYKPEELEPVRKQLQGPGWTRIVSNRTNRESSEIYTKSEQGRMAGIAILSAEPRELTVVYLEGSVDLNALANLGGHFGLPRNLVPGAEKDKAGKSKEKGSKQ